MNNPIIIIDPGHGGRDCGCRFENLFEKDITLKISLYQLNRLRELGINAVISRDKDIYIDPNERTKIIRDSKAKYCISNHINAGGGLGCEVIHSIFNNGQLSHKLFKELTKLGLKGRKVYCRESAKYSQKDYYFIHRDTGSCITNIVEYGFIDNHEDRDRLINNWEEYAEGVIRAFCNFIGHLYTPRTQFSRTENLEFKNAIEKMASHGIISSPQYWLDNKEYETEYVIELIMKVYNYID